MKIFKKIIVCATFLFFVAGMSISSFGQQKLGFMNSAALLSQMQEVKEADANLDVLQKQLQKKGQTMVEELQAKYQELGKKEKSGEIAPKALQDEAAKLKEEEGNISKFEQDMQKQIADKREQLLKPILDKVNAAIAEVSKEKGYSYIVDSSSGFLLYADESFDITKFVKEKLGLK